jgi:hypothetical protein
MNELLLIDMMGELNPALLQDNYMEKDLRRGRMPSFKQIFFFKKSSLKETDEFTANNPLSEEYESKDYERQDEFDVTEEAGENELIKKFDTLDEDSNDWGFNTSIYEKKFKPLYGIISGVAATAIVVSGIVVIIVKRHRAILD